MEAAGQLAIDNRQLAQLRLGIERAAVPLSGTKRWATKYYVFYLSRHGRFSGCADVNLTQPQ